MLRLKKITKKPLNSHKLCSVKVRLVLHPLKHAQTPLFSSLRCELIFISCPCCDTAKEWIKKEQPASERKVIPLLNLSNWGLQWWSVSDHVISFRLLQKLFLYGHVRTQVHTHKLKEVVRSWETGTEMNLCCDAVCVCVLVFVCLLTTELRASLTSDLWYSWPLSVEGHIPLAETETITFKWKIGGQAVKPSWRQRWLT